MYWCWTVFETRFDFLYVKTHCTNFVRCIYYITKLGEMHTIIEKSHRKTTTWRRRMIMLHTMLALVTMPLTYIRVVHTHTRWNRGIETERERDWRMQCSWWMWNICVWECFARAAYIHEIQLTLSPIVWTDSHLIRHLFTWILLHGCNFRYYCSEFVRQNSHQTKEKELGGALRLGEKRTNELFKWPRPVSINTYTHSDIHTTQNVRAVFSPYHS